MRAKAALLSTLLLCTLCSCATGKRMFRAVPFWGEGDLTDAERVNAWPLYYQTKDLVVVLWPLFDLDDKGFALRPLLAREESEWSVLYPLAGWNTENGNWWVVPAYKLQANQGLLPLWNFGEWNHVALAWWVKDDEGEVVRWGLAPLFGAGDFKHVGPVWWKPDNGDEPGSWGLFPLAFFAEQSGYFIPAWWSKSDDGNLETLGVLPLFLYKNEEDYKRLITPLGGRSWGGDGDKQFVNVLGPVFHRSTDGEQSYTAVAWPIFALEQDGEQTGVRVFPLFRYKGSADEASLSMLAGLIRRARDEENKSLRVLPLFSHNKGMPSSFWDSLTLYGYRTSAPADDVSEGSQLLSDVSMHIGTPLFFNYRRSGDKTEWGSLLNILDYETEGDASRFSFLYYLYRRQRKGEQVRRDCFPFFTWDSGPKRSGFAFLWRLLRYERLGDRTRGHFLFLPWGDQCEPEATEGPRGTASTSRRLSPRGASWCP